MRTVSLFLFFILWSQSSMGLQCSDLLFAKKTSQDPTNVTFYMERTADEAFRDLNLNKWDRRGAILNDKLISVEGFPHFVIESDTVGDLVILLPKGLRVSAVVKEREMSFVGQDTITIGDFVIMPDFVKPLQQKSKKVGVKVEDLLVVNQASMQLLGSSTFQKEKKSYRPQFLEAQQEAFEHLLTKLDAKIEIADLKHVNSLITRDSVLRRDDLYKVDTALIRGRDTILELHQDKTGIHYMPARQVPESFEKLMIKINNLSAASTLLDVAEIYQSFIFVHPFPDGNGRTSRALLDYMLLKSGFFPAHHNIETSHIMHYSPSALAHVLFRNLNIYP